MFLVVWLRRLAALPFLWLGQLAAMLKSASCARLFRIAWTTNGDGRVARMALAAAEAYKGPEAAHTLAAQWMETKPRPQIAALLGRHAVMLKDFAAARALLERGHQLGDGPDGDLDVLEYMIASADEGANAHVELARRFEARRDLPSNLSRWAKSELMWDAMLHERFDEARRRADFLLEVDELPDAEAVLWALAVQRGDSAAALAHSSRIVAPRPLKLYVQFLGSFAIGARDEAERFLAELRQADPRLAGMAEHVIQVREAAR